MFDLDTLVKVAPKGVKKNMTQEVVDKLNAMALDAEVAELYRDTVIGYMSVMQDGRFKLEDYLNAAKYCSYKFMGDTNIAAFTKTFPDKYARWVSLGVKDKQIHSYSTAYSKNKLVNMILEQSAIPFYVFNQEARQKALYAQMDLMINARSEKVRSDAANSVLTHTKAPETAKVELDVTVKQTDGISELRAATLAMVEAQRAALVEGSTTPKEVAHSKLFTESGEVVDED